MKRLFLYTTTALLAVSIFACTSSDKKQDLAENTKEVKTEKPEPPAAVVPEGYEIYKSGTLNKEWKLTLVYPEKASVDVIGSQVMIKYSGEDNSFYGGLTDGFNMTMTIVNNEDSQKSIANTTPQVIGNYEMYKFKSANSLGLQVDHYLVNLNTEDTTSTNFVDIALAVKGDKSADYDAMIVDILENMQWERVNA